MKISPSLRFFSHLSLVIAILLVVAGSTVRATGSGLGCPDWPKCFGQLIPPTSESQLPNNYQEIFKIGQREIAPFDAFKTWTEYLNRLLGALFGVVVFILLILSFKYKVIFKWSLILFLLTGIEGALGAKVVSTHLNPKMISLHLIMTILIIAAIQVIRVQQNFLNQKIYLSTPIKNLLPFLVQFFLGIRLREYFPHAFLIPVHFFTSFLVLWFYLDRFLLKKIPGFGEYLALISLIVTQVSGFLMINTEHHLKYVPIHLSAVLVAFACIYKIEQEDKLKRVY